MKINTLLKSHFLTSFNRQGWRADKADIEDPEESGDDGGETDEEGDTDDFEKE